jgi:hypothetical protein
MASTYSAIKIELIGTGDQSGTWGDTTNANLGTAIEQAIVGKADITVSSTSVTLTLTDSNALQDARALFLNLTGTPGGAATLNVPAIEKNYIVKNGTNEEVTIKVAAQTGVAIPAGKTAIVYNNGTDVTTAIDFIPSLTLGAALNVDVISEKTAAAGVTIDGVLLKDTVVTANTVKASGTASSQGKVEFFEDTDNGTNFVALQAPAAIAADVTFTLPAADGTSGQAIQTDGSGTLSFATISASPGGSTTQVQFNNAGAFGGISGVTTDGTRMTVSTTIGVGGATPSTSGNGITFPASVSASTNANTLDDYEEGTFTPSVGNFTVSGSTTLTGRYVKIGKLVSISVTFTNTGTIAFGVSALVGSFPFSGVFNTGTFTMRVSVPSDPQNNNQSGAQLSTVEVAFTRIFVGNFTTTSAGESLIFNGVYEEA